MTAEACLGFGKYADSTWTRVPVGYLRYLVNSGHPQCERAKQEIKRRGSVLPTMEVTGHAVDRASSLFLNKWRSNRQPDEGIHSWLHRTAESALKANQRDDEGRVVYEDMIFAFAEEDRWPVLKTVMRNSKPEPTK